MMSELPTIHQAYRILLQEQKHQELSKLSTPNSEQMGFGAEKRKWENRTAGRMNFSDSSGSVMKSNQNNVKGNKKGNNYFCDHCNIAGHSKERCFKIHGYPPGWKFNQPKKAALAHNTEGEEAAEASHSVNLTTS